MLAIGSVDSFKLAVFARGYCRLAVFWLGFLQRFAIADKGTLLGLQCQV